MGWVGRGGTDEFPLRSPDLTPMDLFLWIYVKNIVHSSHSIKPENMKQRQ